MRVRSIFVPERSDPLESEFFFAYTVEIANLGTESARLVNRHWVITNATGRVEEVRGPGVVGHTPHLQPGEAFEYTSFCPLDTEFGTMQGSYEMARDDGRRFDARIETFVLACPNAVN